MEIPASTTTEQARPPAADDVSPSQEGTAASSSGGEEGISADAMPSEAAAVEDPAPHGRCQVCRAPLPQPVRRHDGKYKGGRRRRYCPAPKDCKEQAQAQREARVAESLADPLKLVAAVADEAVPAMNDAQTVLARALEGFAAITDVTGRQVADMKSEAAAAREQADDACRRAEEVEERAAQAVARSEQDRMARQEAESSATQAREEAAQAKQQAAETIAVHKKACDQAERVAALAVQAEQALAERLETATKDLDAERQAHEKASTELAGCRADLAAARTAAQAAQIDARDAQRRAQTAEREAAEARQAEAAKNAVADRTERENKALGQQLTDMRREADQARREAQRLAIIIEGLEGQRDAARAEAGEQRERAVRAESRAQTLHDQLTARVRPADTVDGNGRGTGDTAQETPPRSGDG